MRKLTENGLVEMKEVLKFKVVNPETKEEFLVNGACKKEWKDKGYIVTPKLVWVEV